MKNILKKHGLVKSIGISLTILSLIASVITLFFKNEEIALVVNIISCLIMLIGLFMMAIMAEKNRLFKSLGVFILASIIFTWILPYGYFQGTDYYDYGMARVGLGDIGMALYYSAYFSIDKIIYLFVLGGFYGVLSICNGYKALVNKIAKIFAKKEILLALIISFLLTGLTSIMSQSMAILILIPFFVSILSQMKIDKLSTFVITFGSSLVGILGASYGTESLAIFNRYLGTELTLGLTYRFIVLAVSYVLYAFFIVMRLRKVLKSKDKSLVVDDPFKVEEPKKKYSIIPALIAMIIIFAFVIIGYIAWETNWKITTFNKFHEWLTTLTIGNDFAIFAQILGKNAVALGTFDMIMSPSILLVAAFLFAVINRVKFAEIVDSFYNGAKKMIRPTMMFFGIYLVFVICYMSPFIPTISNWMFNLTESFNPFITSFIALLSSAFHTDLGYTAYTVGTYVASAYAGDLAIAHTIYVTTYGLVQLFLPTGIILMIGLALMDIDYKTWLKYIWLFVVGIIIILLVLFTVVTYIA
ncbi:MAG: hypothetical protein E7172_06410 [Firmicutes bacterium]|nr:hypothetical protein [Bacillota bacterium]